MEKKTADLFFAHEVSSARGKPCTSRIRSRSSTNSSSIGSMPKFASHSTIVCTFSLANSSSSARRRSREKARTRWPVAPPQ